MRFADYFLRTFASAAVLLAALILLFPLRAEAFFSYDGLLLGASINGEWVSDGDLQQDRKYHDFRIWGGEGVQLYSLLKKEGEGVALALPEDHEEDGMPPDPARFLRVQVSAAKTHSVGCALLAVSGEKDALPRAPVALGVKNEAYRNAVREYLESCGVQEDHPEITQIFRIDLEGDGVDEVLINAQNLLKPSDPAFSSGKSLWKTAQSGIIPARKKGAYSVILLRRVVQGKVETIPLAEMFSDSSRSAFTLFKISQFADLDGDGKLEVILTSASSGRYACTVYEPGKATSKRLSNAVELR